MVESVSLMFLKINSQTGLFHTASQQHNNLKKTMILDGVELESLYCTVP